MHRFQVIQIAHLTLNSKLEIVVWLERQSREDWPLLSLLFVLLEKTPQVFGADRQQVRVAVT